MQGGSGRQGLQYGEYPLLGSLFHANSPHGNSDAAVSAVRHEGSVSQTDRDRVEGDATTRAADVSAGRDC